MFRFTGLSGFFSCAVMTFIAVCANAPAARGAPPADVTITIPQIAAVDVKKPLDTWKNQAYSVNTMMSALGNAWPKKTAPATVYVGWNKQGLVVGAEIVQPEIREHDYIRNLFKGDSIEVFLSTKKGSHDRYMLVASPGLDPKYPKPRYCFFADPSEEKEKNLESMVVEVHAAPTDTGYTMVLTLPWSNLGITPGANTEIGLQIYVMQSEGEKCHTAMWHPAGGSHLDVNAVHRVILGEKGSDPINVLATVQEDLLNKKRTLRVVGTAAMVGKSCQIRMENGVLFAGLTAQGGQACATFNLPFTASPDLRIDRQPLPTIVLTPENDLPVVLSEKLRSSLQQYVVESGRIPEARLEGAPGFKISKVLYFDSQYKQVDVPRDAGRHGAVIEFVDSSGRTMRRFQTFFVAPPEMLDWQRARSALENLPSVAARNPKGQALLDKCIINSPFDATRLARPEAIGSPESAKFLACLYEDTLASPPKRDIGDFREVDRQWWVGLKRKIYGWDKQFAQEFVCPVPAEAKGRVLREGKPEEAGVTAEAIEEADRMCRLIEEETKEPVSICIARHGVIILHRAYGQLNGQPMTNETPCNLYSATKTFGGTLMMLAVDKGVVNLDDSVDKFLPPFKDIKVKVPMTIRHIYTHMSGLGGLWGDDVNDMEEIVAGYYTSLNVGYFQYSETAGAFGGKIIEAVSGEAFPYYAKRHLLDPLGMKNTSITASGWKNYSTAGDMAKVAQMILNRGTYGDQKFFSEKTYKQFFPIPGWGPRSGIGIQPMGGGLSGNTYGHDGQSSSTIYMDFNNDMLVTISSGGDAKKFVSQISRVTSKIMAVIKDNK